jgi:hypothetical protein
MRARPTRSALALALGALLAAAAPVLAKPKPPKPPPPKPPKLELLTRSQAAALRQNRIKFGVQSADGRRVRVTAELVVEGIPDDFHFQLKPQRKPLHDGEATVSMNLSQRQREVLAFAEQACMSADVNAQAKVGSRASTIHDSLRKSPGC